MLDRQRRRKEVDRHRTSVIVGEGEEGKKREKKKENDRETWRVETNSKSLETVKHLGELGYGELFSLFFIFKIKINDLNYLK
jgi:hypothetical protein